MTTKNEHTGATLMTRVPTKEYEEGWERIFGKKEQKWPAEENLKRNDDQDK